MQTVRRWGVMLAGASALTTALALPANATGFAPADVHEFQFAWSGKCDAILYLNDAKQASSGTYQSQTASNSEICVGWLDRTTDGGHTWTTISGYHDVYDQGASSYTGWYWDGPGYQARACVRNAVGITACTSGWTAY